MIQNSAHFNCGTDCCGTRQKHADAIGIGVQQVELRVISDVVDRVFGWCMKMKLHQLIDVGPLRPSVKVAGGIAGHFDIVAGVFEYCSFELN